jgi:hypothetical protein
MDNKPKTLMRRGAQSGLVMGGYFILLFAAMILSYSSHVAGLLSMIMFLATPFLAYRRLRQSFISLHGLTTFAALWLEGIVMMACGALLLALASFIFFRFISPNFIPQQVEMMSSFYSAMPDQEFQQLGATLRKALDQHLLPRPIEVAMSLAWLTAFTGSILSLILAAIARRPFKRNPF